MLVIRISAYVLELVTPRRNNVPKRASERTRIVVDVVNLHSYQLF